MAKIIRTNDSRGPSLGAQRRVVEFGSPEALNALTSEMIALAEVEAQRIVEASRAEAAEIEQQAAAVREEADLIRKQAAEELQSAQEQVAQIRQTVQEEAAAERERVVMEDVSRLRELLHQLAQQVADHNQQWQQTHNDALDLGLAIAEQVIRSHVERDSQIVVESTREALYWISAAAKITVRISPEDLEEHAETISAALSELHPAAQCELVADESISRGGSRVETEFGVIDQTVDAQLARVEEELRDV